MHIFGRFNHNLVNVPYVATYHIWNVPGKNEFLALTTRSKISKQIPGGAKFGSASRYLKLVHVTSDLELRMLFKSGKKFSRLSPVPSLKIHFFFLKKKMWGQARGGGKPPLSLQEPG